MLNLYFICVNIFTKNKYGGYMKKVLIILGLLLTANYAIAIPNEYNVKVIIFGVSS